MAPTALKIQSEVLCPPKDSLDSKCARSGSTDHKSILIVDDTTLEIFQILFAITLNLFFSILGVITNIINMIIFGKIGFSDTTNISLFGLTISDLGSLLVNFQMVFLDPLILPADIAFNAYGVQYLAMGVPYVWLSRTTSWLTVFIVLERYLCVVTPLKVKTIITPKRSIWVVGTIYVVTGIGSISVYYANSLDWTFNPYRNRTILDLVQTPDVDAVNRISNPINYFLVQTGSFLAVIILTIQLVTKLAEKTAWRQQTASKTDTISHRDQKVAKMIIFICIIFIVCYAPMTISYMWTAVDPQYSATGTYRNLFLIVVFFAHFTQGVSSSTNMFIYLKMSTKYREMFQTVFCRARSKSVETSSK